MKITNYMKIKICNHVVSGYYYRLIFSIENKTFIEESFFIQTLEYYVDKISNKET